METTVGTAFSLLFLSAMFLLVLHATERTQCLTRLRPILMLIALLWWSVPIAKRAYIDDVFYPDDSVLHEAHARDIAYLISEKDWEQVREYAGLGNEAYRLALGVFYSVTGAPEVTTYQIHGMLAFWGLLSLLEMACHYAGPRKVPLWIVFICLLNPSALFWTTFNLKEGAMLWGICMTLRIASRLGTTNHPNDGPSRNQHLFLPALGILVAGILRPHIIVAYLTALTIGVAVRRGHFAWAGISLGGVVLGLVGLKYIAPGLYAAFVADGLSVTLNEKFHELSLQGGSVITYSRGAPIPLISGVILLLARPLPWEASNVVSLLAGAEVWIMLLIGTLGWLTVRNRSSHLKTDYVITLLCAFLALSFYFTYIYNMGLMVRQRVMVFPTMLSLVIIPGLAKWASITDRRAQPLLPDTPPLRPVFAGSIHPPMPTRPYPHPTVANHYPTASSSTPRPASQPATQPAAPLHVPLARMRS